MKCEPIDMGGGVTGFVCSRGKRKQSCSVPGCGNRMARECDYPIQRPGRTVTCDRALCVSCATKIGISREGDSVDFCPPHVTVWRAKDPFTFRDVAPAVRQLMGLRAVGFREASIGDRTVIVHGTPDLPIRSPGSNVRQLPIERVEVTPLEYVGTGQGARDKVIVASALALLVDLVLGDGRRDAQTIIVVQREPIVFEASDPDRWSFRVMMGVGRLPEKEANR